MNRSGKREMEMDCELTGEGEEGEGRAARVVGKGESKWDFRVFHFLGIYISQSGLALV